MEPKREVHSVTEYPELGETRRSAGVFPTALNSEYPLIDCDPHFKRVIGYARPSDYAVGAFWGSMIPAGILAMERFSPTNIPRVEWRSCMRVSGGVGLMAAFFFVYTRSVNRFYGFSENRREVEMDMREMTDKVKRGEPLYGKSTLSSYLQSAAARQSRYSGVFVHIMPWFNFVNHDHHGVDTAKYYRNAERELEAERRR
ncbi:hypothetical protein K470DRAFT_280018 [Piedraia hortae CBS 480.64]|uniref:NADH-ubiquinone oxidoreductase-like protein 21 kDa subunit n=1 Tax=Piedraia hortae CBS 480.64 TaxID=1314780 RepID=A0A6A7C8G2_9PEZI|nr:hypothetical protein K470DRAFT_280018 [Piedraia hortae CBS 480.64]